MEINLLTLAALANIAALGFIVGKGIDGKFRHGLQFGVSFVLLALAWEQSRLNSTHPIMDVQPEKTLHDSADADYSNFPLGSHGSPLEVTERL